MRAPLSSETELSLFAKTNFRNGNRTFGIQQRDRRAHLYAIGKTGTGKSTLLETLILQDLHADRGFAVLDPHGPLIESVLSQVPTTRTADIIYIDVTSEFPEYGLNPLFGVLPTQRMLATSGLLDIFRKLWPEFWGPRSEHVLRNAFLALLDQPFASLADVLRLFDDPAYRKNVALRVANVHVRTFWLREFEQYPARFRVEVIAPLQNKIGAFVSNPLLARVLLHPAKTIDFGQVMDEGKVLLVNLAMGKVGEDTASLLGSLITSSIGLAALGRASENHEAMRSFYLYADEFQHFTTLSFANMLSELRKYHVGIVIANQYLAQLDNPIRSAVLGNVGTLIVFRVGAEDAKLLVSEFAPEISATDLMRLPNRDIYIKLLVNGAPVTPFSATTLKLTRNP